MQTFLQDQWAKFNCPHEVPIHAQQCGFVFDTKAYIKVCVLGLRSVTTYILYNYIYNLRTEPRKYLNFVKNTKCNISSFICASRCNLQKKPLKNSII